MRIVCLVKFTPDTNNFKYDYEKNILVRESAGMIINPDDASALAYALQLKKVRDVSVDVVTMGPRVVIALLRDLLRCGADRAALLTAPEFIGSDTYVTSKILCRHLKSTGFDLILTGTHSIDGDTAHVPAQVAQFFGLPLLSGIRQIEPPSQDDSRLTCVIETDNAVARYTVCVPAVLGIAKESGYRLPFVRYADLNLDVDDRIEIVTNQRLRFESSEVGLAGSLTKVVSARPPQYENRQRVVVGDVDEGVEVVYRLLKDKGFVK